VRPARLGDVVSVKWVDASARSTWHDKEGVRDFSNTEYLVETIGFLSVVSRRALIVAGSLASTGDQGELMRIPRGMVQRITVLRRQR
jgi:hypothetical protein